MLERATVAQAKVGRCYSPTGGKRCRLDFPPISCHFEKYFRFFGRDFRLRIENETELSQQSTNTSDFHFGNGGFLHHTSMLREAAAAHRLTSWWSLSFMTHDDLDQHQLHIVS